MRFFVKGQHNSNQRSRLTSKFCFKNCVRFTQENIWNKLFRITELYANEVVFMKISQTNSARSFRGYLQGILDRP